MRRLSIVTITAGLLVAGCSGTSTGTVVGSFLTAGGPRGFPPEHLTGTVILTSAHGRRISIAVAKGKFIVNVPPGRYQATGRAPGIGWGPELCSANTPVVVVAGGQSTVDVACQIK